MQFKTKGLKELQKAFKRNPKKTKSEISSFLVHAIRVYNKGIIRRPWRVGQSGGGAPVDTGMLRDTHKKKIKRMEAVIYPTRPYAEAVHKDRPWLDYVFNKSMGEIKKLEDKMLKNITIDLAK